MKKKVLIISLSKLYRDPRILRQYEALKDEYDITTIGLAKISDEIRGYIVDQKAMSKKQKLIKGLHLLIRNYNTLEQNFLTENPIIDFDENERFDYVIINDIPSLPFLKLIHPETKVCLDMHEYSPRQFENLWYWDYTFKPYVEWLLRKYKSRISSFSTVCESIAEEYQNKFGIEKVEVVTNAPKFQTDLKPSEIDERVIRLVHHGVANRGRKLEKLIDAMALLGSGYSLDFYLVAHGDKHKAYLEELKKRAEGLPIHFNDAVATESIPQEINKYDIGVFLLEPNTFNHKYTLPNKLFEFVQARLSVVVSPNPEMKKIIDEFEIGTVSSDYTVSSFVESIKKIKPSDLVTFKNNSNTIAPMLSFEENISKIKNLIPKVG